MNNKFTDPYEPLREYSNFEELRPIELLLDKPFKDSTPDDIHDRYLNAISVIESHIKESSIDINSEIGKILKFCCYRLNLEAVEYEML